MFDEGAAEEAVAEAEASVADDDATEEDKA